MNGKGRIIKFFKKFSKEIVIALVLALVAAIALEWWNNWSQQQAIQHDLKAVATIVALESKGKVKGQGSGFFYKFNWFTCHKLSRY